MQDRPTLDELLEAVQEFLERDVVEAGGRVGFHGRVAANVVGIVRREATLGPGHDEAERERLRAILGRDIDDLREANVELAAGVRDGRFDDRRREVLDALLATAVDKLRVANPRHLEEE
ncbi:MAG TPA: DUF6285 domain-containing protein [Acidimicrobiia bacterium]|nr:DUF6285 domain-containing protein [Acidimicrobiia bacterium]